MHACVYVCVRAYVCVCECVRVCVCVHARAGGRYSQLVGLNIKA